MTLQHKLLSLQRKIFFQRKITLERKITDTVANPGGISKRGRQPHGALIYYFA